MMKIELLGAIDYTKLRNMLEEKNVRDIDEIIDYIVELEKEGYERKASTMDHDYFVFDMRDVSPVIEQTVIAERSSSFTIRREADFCSAGFVVPNFRGKDGLVLADNAEIQGEYTRYMHSLFDLYSSMVDRGIAKEEARFVLPYCYHSNILMGIDVHTLKDLIIKYTKTHLSKIQEIKELGERLYAIAQEHVPYIISEINKVPVTLEDPTKALLDSAMEEEKPSYYVLTEPRLINKTGFVDQSILISAIMRRYHLDNVRAHNLLYRLWTYPAFGEQLMREIVLKGDKEELTQVNFQFQVPLSFAALAHLTRHCTQHILIPEFSPIVDLSKYKVPDSIREACLEEFEEAFLRNQMMYEHFRDDYGICEEDLVYFTLSGNTCNVITNMDGKTLEHIVSLSTCNKTQWETRAMARGLIGVVAKEKDAAIFASLLGPSCETLYICKEEKESCGKVLAYPQQK